MASSRLLASLVPLQAGPRHGAVAGLLILLSGCTSLPDDAGRIDLNRPMKFPGRGERGAANEPGAPS